MPFNFPNNINNSNYTNNHFSKWFYFSFPVGSNYLHHLDIFKSKYVLPSSRYFLLVKILCGDNEWITLCSTLYVDYSNFDIYSIQNIIIKGINKFSTSYDIKDGVHSVNLAFCSVNDDIVPSNRHLIRKEDVNIRELSKIRSEFLSVKYFPFSIDINKFGVKVNTCRIDSSIVSTFIYSSDVTLVRTSFDNDPSSFSTVVMLNNSPFFTFSDKIINDSLFMRSIDNLNMYFTEGKHLYSEINVKFKKIQPLTLYPSYDQRFLTLDIETYMENKTHVPYLLGFYDGYKYYTFHLADYSSPEDLIVACFNSLLAPKYRNLVVYVHNLGRFDGVFLIKYLFPHFKIKPILKDNRIYSLSIRTVPNTYKLQTKKLPNVTIYLHDSFLLLPFSLRQLCKEYNVISKGYFPYLFVSKSSLNYEGPTPPIHYYADLPNSDHYKTLYSDSWNLKAESLKYLKVDLLSLYEVIKIFSERIFGSFVLDLKDYLTLPSLAFALFRSSFFGNSKNLLPLINKPSRFKFINDSYFGGSTDIYQPYGNNVYCYDVNSLYPSALKNVMPVGDGVYSTDPSLSNWFGFIKVEVSCPSNLKSPLLPLKKEDGTVIHPTGTWTGTYFSEELKNAQKYGYTFKLIEGIKFEKGFNIFDEYVDHFYDLKINGSDTEKKLAKLLLNSLYGRMGLKPVDSITSVVNHHEAQYIMSKYEVIDHQHNIGESFEILKYSKILKDNKTYVDENLFQLKGDQYIYSQQSVAVASALTAYGRIYMSQFKNSGDNTVLYTDTDSLFMTKPLDAALVGPNLGQFKLENICSVYYAINPKVYLLITKEGKLIRKTAGFKYELEPKECEALLYYHCKPINIINSKWKRKISSGTITLDTINLMLSPQHSKRIPLYNSKGEWYSTKPLKLERGSIVNYLPVPVKPLK